METNDHGHSSKNVLTGVGVSIIGTAIFVLFPFAFFRSALYANESRKNSSIVKSQFEGVKVRYNGKVYTITNKTWRGFTLTAEDGEVKKGIAILSLDFIPPVKKTQPKPQPVRAYQPPVIDTNFSDAVEGLRSLGYKVADAKAAVSVVYSQGKSIETIIKEALKTLNKNK